ncbi:MAG: glycoside hydrolase family 16 protein [Demequinaceae bacterium]|nr:glycoside hydrolase family 16 protein [Demequinaceae bacterium]
MLAGCGSAPSDLSSTRPANPCVSGECAPVGDLPGWRQVFVDEFDGTVAPGQWSGCTFVEPLTCSGLPEPYRDRWWAFLEGWSDNANGVYSPSRVLSVSGGVLDVSIRTEDGVHLVAAPVPLINGIDGPLGQLYGRYEIRFCADSLPGYKIAWLLWPDSEAWPRDGEIDFPEGNLDGDIEGYVHRQDGAAPNDQDGFFTGVPVSGEWHTAIIEWSPDLVVFILDGDEIGTTTNRIPTTPMHWVLEVTTSLDGHEPDDVTEGHVLIDWVAVYSPE